MEQVHLDLDPLVLTTRLYDAALKGDVNSLHIVFQKDPLILDRCMIEKPDRFMRSPLHVATNLGHLEFVTQLLSLNPDLSEELDRSTRSSALHLASAKGHLDIVEKLIEVNSNMCLVTDRYGRNPVHVAAISGQLHVLDLLVRTNPHSARERTHAGETVLHLCVKYAKLESLKYLLNAIDDSEFVNAKDVTDNTVLHLAVVANQLQAVKFLVANKKLDQNAINEYGLRAIDCINQNSKNPIDKEIIRTLKRAKTFEAKHVLQQNNKDDKWLKKQSNALMVVALLIATMAFQTGVNPPGGVWQDDLLNTNNPHLLGTSIMANRAPGIFKSLTMVNTISLISSLSVVLLLISGITCKRLFVVLLMIIMWVATTTTTLTYYFSLDYLKKEAKGGIGSIRQASHESHDSKKSSAYGVSLVIVWVILVAIGYAFRVLFKPLMNLAQLVKTKLCKDQQSASTLP